MITDTFTLADRVNQLIHVASKRPRVWGNPLVSTTPVSIAIRDLAERTEVLEEAVREISLRLDRLEDEADSSEQLAEVHRPKKRPKKKTPL